jgi:hypothetical protein
VLNGFYGFSAIMPTNFEKTRLVTDSYLRSRRGPGRRKYGLGNGRFFRVTLLGAMPLREGEKSPRLLFSASSRNPTASIRNLLHIGGAILSMSRVIFLSRILSLLRILDPGKVELMYTDTDSIILAASSASMDDLLRPWVSPERAEEVFRSVFEDKSSDFEQSSLFKHEGKSAEE